MLMHDAAMHRHYMRTAFDMIKADSLFQTYLADFVIAILSKGNREAALSKEGAFASPQALKACEVFIGHCQEFIRRFTPQETAEVLQQIQTAMRSDTASTLKEAAAAAWPYLQLWPEAEECAKLFLIQIPLHIQNRASAFTQRPCAKLDGCYRADFEHWSHPANLDAAGGVDGLWEKVTTNPNRRFIGITIAAVDNVCTKVGAAALLCPSLSEGLTSVTNACQVCARSAEKCRVIELALSNLYFKARDPSRYSESDIRAACAQWMRNLFDHNLGAPSETEPVWKQEVHRDLRVAVLIRAGLSQREAEYKADELAPKKRRTDATVL